MALTITRTRQIDDGPADRGGTRLKLLIGSIAFDSSYPTGGEAMDLSNDLGTIHAVQFFDMSGYSFEYDYANKKVIVYWGDYAQTTAVDKAHVQVADTTDLSALTDVRFIAWGE